MLYNQLDSSAEIYFAPCLHEIWRHSAWTVEPEETTDLADRGSKMSRIAGNESLYDQPPLFDVYMQLVLAEVDESM